MRFAVIIMWNFAAVSVLLAWIFMLWDKRSIATGVWIGIAALLGALGGILNWYFELGLS